MKSIWNSPIISMWKPKCWCDCLVILRLIVKCKKWAQLQTSRMWYQQWHRSRKGEFNFMPRELAGNEGWSHSWEHQAPTPEELSTLQIPHSSWGAASPEAFPAVGTTGSIPLTWAGPDQPNQFSFILLWLWQIPFDLEALLLKPAKGEAKGRRRRCSLPRGSFSPTLFLGWDSCFEVQATLKSSKGFKAPSEGENKMGNSSF